MMMDWQIPGPVSTGDGRFLRCAVLSDLGLWRGNNEDNYLLDGKINEKSADHVSQSSYLSPAPRCWQLVGMFDGMGGCEKGEVASLIAAQTFREAAEMLTGLERDEAAQLLRRTVTEANRRIVAELEDYASFGTTCTVLCTDGRDARVFQLGDSRAYLQREDTLYPLTKDQTLAQMKLDLGLLQEGDPRIEREKHRLTDFLGRDHEGSGIRAAESEWISLLPGDRLLLCSDGLYDFCDSAQLLGIITQAEEPSSAARQLLYAAISGGSTDNISSVLLYVNT